MDLYLSRGSRLVSSVLLSSEDCSQSEVSIEVADQSQLSIHLLAARHRGVVRHCAHRPRHVPSAGLLAPLAPGPHLCVDIFRFMVQGGPKKGRSQNIIVFHELLSLGCINFKNLCAHHKEEVLRFPKHPQLVKFG